MTSFNLLPGTDSQYYLVVPANTDAGNHEGSYGTDSSGAERPPGLPACLDQSIDIPVCPGSPIPPQSGGHRAVFGQRGARAPFE